MDEDGRRTARRTAHAAAGTRRGEDAAGGRGDVAEMKQISDWISDRIVNRSKRLENCGNLAQFIESRLRRPKTPFPRVDNEVVKSPKSETEDTSPTVASASTDSQMGN